MATKKEVRDMSPAEKEAFHQQAEARIKTFSYRRPEMGQRPKEFAPLCRSELLRIVVQVIKDGGENNLHYHTHSDTTWMVLRGRARFYGVDDKVLGELGPHEGILLPGGSRYWFEKVGDDEYLEILQMIGIESNTVAPPERINLERHKAWMQDDYLQVYEQGPVVAQK
jgi:mannose-6-phosphate isomerase-like protein (cupin superfamily)